MSVYVLTGKLGNGKTLSAVGRIQTYLKQGRRIATNLDLFMEHYPEAKCRNARVIRLPDKPSIDDMMMIGRGDTGWCADPQLKRFGVTSPDIAKQSYDESKFGLLVLDECGTWFNSRNWNEPGRKELNDWFLHSRKLGWDVIIIIQSIDILDKQARECLAEHTVFCKRMDNFTLPLIGTISKLFMTKPLSLPRLHVAIVKYGTSPQSMTADRWIFRGTDLFNFYDTQQVFLNESSGMYSLLTPWHLVGRYLPPPDFLIQLKRAAQIPILFFAWLVVVILAAVSGRSPDTVATLLRSTTLVRSHYRAPVKPRSVNRQPSKASDPQRQGEAFKRRFRGNPRLPHLETIST